ncbi:MAG: hypothetical protein SPL49_07355, partial [Oribacterium sp.]|nr:hypothetical protein [Oribacterium sp.]
MEQYFVRNVETKEWMLCEEPQLNKIDIERVPVVFIVREKGVSRAWCLHHRTYEEVTTFATTEVQTAVGCRLHGLCVEYVVPKAKEKLPTCELLHVKTPVSLPARWWLYRRDEAH